LFLYSLNRIKQKKEHLFLSNCQTQVVIVCFYIIGYGLALQITLSFFGGYLVYFWLGYFQILYWEHKNHKKIYFDKNYGKWKKSYIIRENK